jgi:hypothetical protein
MKINAFLLFGFFALVRGAVLADQSIGDALTKAKIEISKANSTAELFFPVVTETSFLSGLEVAIQSYEDLLLLEAEKKIDVKESDTLWCQVYRPIYQQILTIKMLPEGVSITEMKHIVPISKNSSTKKCCQENSSICEG